MRNPINRIHNVQQCGFSLLEVLVAFTILAISLGILMQIFGRGAQLASTSENYSRALLYAESTLATVGLDEEIEPGETSGEFDELFGWSINIQLYEDQDLDLENDSFSFSVYHVQVSVFWENQSIVLETLRFGPQA